MIFVITGTEKFPFNRLIHKIDVLKEKGILDEDVYMQLGSSTYIPQNCRWQQWFSFPDMIENIKKSSLVITHAGAGTTLLCLELGKTPIIVTRRSEHGEHLDNHQIPFAKMMESLSYVVCAYDVDELDNSILKYTQNSSTTKKLHKDNSQLVSYLDLWFNS